MKSIYEVKMYIDKKDWGGYFFFSYIKAREWSETMMNWAYDREKYREIKYGIIKEERLCKVFKPIIKHWILHTAEHNYEIYILKVKVQ